jgi:hypothetical protein
MSSCSAWPSAIAAEATVMDLEGSLLRHGTNAWTCIPVPEAPVCLDERWMIWFGAYLGQHDEANVTAVGLACMLQGDGGASNIDPNAEEPTPDNEWVVTGPHLMIIVPDPALPAGIPTDPATGGPDVMWRSHPLVHVMVPVNGVQLHQH